MKIFFTILFVLIIFTGIIGCSSRDAVVPIPLALPNDDNTLNDCNVWINKFDSLFHARLNGSQESLVVVAKLTDYYSWYATPGGSGAGSSGYVARLNFSGFNETLTVVSSDLYVHVPKSSVGKYFRLYFNQTKGNELIVSIQNKSPETRKFMLENSLYRTEVVYCK